MNRTILEHEIRKYNFKYIQIVTNKEIKPTENLIISDESLKQFDDNEIKELYVKLKLGKLLYEVGYETVETVFKQIKK